MEGGGDVVPSTIAPVVQRCEPFLRLLGCVGAEPPAVGRVAAGDEGVLVVVQRRRERLAACRRERARAERRPGGLVLVKASVPSRSNVTKAILNSFACAAASRTRRPGLRSRRPPSPTASAAPAPRRRSPRPRPRRRRPSAPPAAAAPTAAAAAAAAVSAATAPWRQPSAWSGSGARGRSACGGARATWGRRRRPRPGA